MVAGLWLSGMGGFEESSYPLRQPVSSNLVELQTRIRDLEHQVGRLALLNQALWELLRDRIKVTEQELEELVREIDLRDGVQDGRITNTGLQCPTCGRISSSKHWKCLYCGQLFEKPIVG